MTRLHAIFSPLTISLAVICLTSLTSATSHPDVVYLDRPCGAQYNVSDNADIRIKMGFIDVPAGNYSCSLTVSAANTSIKGITLIAHFRNLYMDYEEDGCNHEAVQIFSSSGERVLPPWCKSFAPTNTFVLGAYGVIEVYSNFTNGTGTLNPPSFDLLVASGVEKDDGPNATCAGDYFDCQFKNLCVPKDLTCNGYNDCGNNRDEEEGCGLLPTVIALIAVSIFIVGVLLLVFSICCYKRQKAKGMYIQM